MSGAILVVDDHPLYRDALLQVLRTAFGDFTLLVAGSASQVLAQTGSIQPKNGSYPGAASVGGGTGKANMPTIRWQM